MGGAAFLFTKQNSSLPCALKTTLISSDSRDSTFYQYGSQFGRSVAIDIDENTVVVGAALTDEGAPSTYGKGAAYIYYKPSGGWTLGSTQPDHKIFPKIRQVSENFGFQVAIYKDNIVVGAHSSNKATNKGGAAYVYRKNPDNSWGTLPLVCSTMQTGFMCGTTENKVLLPPNKAGLFAWSVAMDDGVLVIGEPASYESEINSVFIYLQDPSTLEFPTTPSQRILGHEGLNIELDGGTAVYIDGGHNEGFGQSVSIDGPNLVIGAFRAGTWYPYTDGRQFGLAYLYTRNASTNVFEFGSKLSSTDDLKTDAPAFGWAVGISGASIVVGAPQSDLYGTKSGALYTFGAGAPITKADFCKQPELPCSLPGFIYPEQSQDWEEITAKAGDNYPHYTTYDDCASHGSSRFKVMMGCITDFYKPKPGETLCNALDSTSKFLWSATLDGDYVDAGNYGPYKGGSSFDWPKNNVEGDERWLLPIWVAAAGKPVNRGCCHVTKFNCLNEGKYEQTFHNWGRAFKIFAYVG